MMNNANNCLPILDALRVRTVNFWFESCMELGLTGFGSMQYVDPAGLSVKLLEPHGFGVAKL